jgi:NAD(P)H-nitrite reductase large subunit
VVEAHEFGTNNTMVSASQPDAVDQARIAALNMVGQPAQYGGSIAINVLDTMGLISSSFGQWQGVKGGDGVEQADADSFRYLSLQFLDDIVVGATAVGLTQNVGALRGLIQNRVKLGKWKKVLMEDPSRFAEAYIARAQRSAMLHPQQ